MIIRCDKCSAKFKVDDSKIPDKGARVKCKKCQHIFKVESPQIDVIETKPEETVSPTIPSAVHEGDAHNEVKEVKESSPPSEIEHDFWGTELPLKEEEKKEIPEKKVKIEKEQPSLQDFEEDFGIVKEVEEEKGIGEEELTTGGFKDEFISREEDTPQVAHRREKKGFSIKGIIISLIILLVVVVGGISLLRSNLISDIINGISGKIDNNRGEEGNLGINGLKGYYYDNNKQAGRLFVIEGRLVNPWNFSITSDSVKGSIFDSNGNKVQEKTVISGSILTKKQLIDISADVVEVALRSQPKKTVVEAGTSFPFMIVFFNVPDDLSEFLVEVSE